jgi:dipeptidyl aminopeptidase/acylaminoacyl peptidase
MKKTQIGGFLIAVGFLVSVAVASDGMTLRQIAEIQQVGQLAIHPDGDLIAYTLSVPRTLGEEEDGPAWTQLHVVDRQGQQRAFVSGQVNVGGVQFAPDGKHLVFLSKRDGDAYRSLYRIPLDGGEATKWFEPEADIRSYSFHHSGQRLAYLASAAEDEQQKALREKGFSQRIYEEQLKPVQVWVQSLADTGQAARRLEVEGSVNALQYSPVDDRLALTVSPTPLIDDVLMRSRIRVVSDTDGALLASIDNPGKLGDVAWSPDGQQLAMIGVEGINDPAAGRLQIVDSDGGEIRNLLPDLAGHISAIAWRGERLAYISAEGVETRLGEIAADGSQNRDLLSAGGPIWRSFDIAEDGALALVADTPQHPREVYLADSGPAQRLTHHNSWLDDLALAEQVVVDYQARDGLDLQGILVYPLGYQQGQRYPLILGVHGGPEAHYSNGWMSNYSLPAQAAAARGMAMFFPNYRASTGRGVAFSKLNHGKPAAEEFDDLVDGVDHLIETGLVDEERVGITGGSYGGYASAWGATYYSERFAASVMFVGLSDKIAMLGTSDIPTELYHVHYLTWPWENWQLYREASPIYHAAKSRTPTLILHGDADPRVDRSQSMSMYRYLKLHGQAPVRLVLYPGEGHGNSRAASRWDYSLRMMRWMEHYLIGDGGEPPAPEVDYQLSDDDDA